MFPLIRSLTYASLFVALLLLLLPARLLEWSGLGRPDHLGPAQISGAALVVLGAALAIWCVLTFAVVGRGTPAPFDPPRRLVRSGPYRWVRNPMYVGAVCALLGAAEFYGSLALLAYALVFLAIAHLFVTGYEEQVLERTFGPSYRAYRNEVGRWIPRWRQRGKGRRQP